MGSQLPQVLARNTRSAITSVRAARPQSLFSPAGKSPHAPSRYHGKSIQSFSTHWSHGCLSSGCAGFSTSSSTRKIEIPLCRSKGLLPQQFRTLLAANAQCSRELGLYSRRCLSQATTRLKQQSNSGSDGERDPKVTPTTTSTTTLPNILTKISPLTSKEAKENIYTLPNFLTFSRLLAAPAIGYAILTSHPHLALGLFAYAGITDLVDGYLARRFNSATVVGTILDPMADKTLMTTVVVCLTIQGILPLWLSTIILGRDIALAISAIYFRWISLPPPKTFTRYWDFSLPSAEVRPTEISKINTFLQLLLVGNAMLLPTLPAVSVVDAWNLYGVYEGWQYLVATTTIWSGLSYIWTKDAVKILSDNNKQTMTRK